MCAFIANGEIFNGLEGNLKEIEEPVDPPITRNGKLQAIKTGYFLKKYLVENDFTEVKI